MNREDTVSFIIPHKGRLDMLTRTIQSIAEQDYPIDKLDVIVVSQTEGVELIEKEFRQSKLAIIFLQRPEPETISELRNYGVKHATGNYLAFLDADIFLAPNWINTMFSEISKENKRVLVSAMQVCDSDPNPLECIRACQSNVVLDTNVNFLTGRNLFMARHIFDEAGGFPPHLVTCEDYYFTDKVSNIGNLYYTSSTTYVHLGEDKNIKDMFKKEIWRGQSNIHSIRGRKINIRELPSIVLPLGIAVFLIASVVSLVLHFYSVATVLFVLALLPVCVYSFRLYYISKFQLGIGLLLRFYIVYFFARMIGTLTGIFKPIRMEHK